MTNPEVEKLCNRSKTLEGEEQPTYTNGRKQLRVMKIQTWIRAVHPWLSDRLLSVASYVVSCPVRPRSWMNTVIRCWVTTLVCSLAEGVPPPE